MQLVKNEAFNVSKGKQQGLMSSIKVYQKHRRFSTTPKEGCKSWNLVTQTQFINCSFHPNCEVYLFRNCAFHDCEGVQWLTLDECEVVD